jgi:vancomycin permeability regulator SanA
LAILAAAKAGSYLVLDSPQPSDAILVLAGETEKRPERALQLMAQGYGRSIVLDVAADTKIYEFTQLQLAEKYIHDSPHPAAMRVCPIAGLSTRDESRDAEKCLAGMNRVLIVTSDFHTRRALSIFRKEIPTHEYSIAAARLESQFGAPWWSRRQWAKTCVDEWMRLLWWNLIDRWR